MGRKTTEGEFISLSIKSNKIPLIWVITVDVCLQCLNWSSSGQFSSFCIPHFLSLPLLYNLNESHYAYGTFIEWEFSQTLQRWHIHMDHLRFLRTGWFLLTCPSMFKCSSTLFLSQQGKLGSRLLSPESRLEPVISPKCPDSLHCLALLRNQDLSTQCVQYNRSAF